MAYMNKDERRASIVDAAVSIIVRDGLAAATVRGVANFLNASPGQIHHHFSSADELRAEAFAKLWDGAMRGFREKADRYPTRDRLLVMLLGETHEGDAITERLWREALLASEGEGHVRATVRNALLELLSLMVEIIDTGMETGDFASRLPSAEVARRLLSLSLGSDVLMGLEFPAHSRSEVRARVSATVEELLTK